MKIHEFQAKELFKQSGVSVLRHVVARTAEEAAAAYDELATPIVVIKAQIHAGGRGKGTVKEVPGQHGVQLVKSREEAAQVALNLLGNTLVTIQTPQFRVFRACPPIPRGNGAETPNVQKTDMLRSSEKKNRWQNWNLWAICGPIHYARHV